MDSNEDKLQFEAACLIIETQDIKGVTQDVVNTIMNRVNKLFESFLGVLLNNFQSKCGPQDALSIEEISDIVNSYFGQDVFEGVQTRDRLDSYVDSYEGLVKPVKTVLMQKEVIKGNKTQMVPVEWGYHVPFEPSLQKFLSCPEVMHCVDNPLPHTPGVFRTALDGAFYRTQCLVKKDPHLLAVQIYADGAEVTDSASSKSGLHGLLFVYWTLLNVHPDKRSSLNAIGLLAVARSSYVKKHGYKILLQDFVHVMNQLSSCGLTLNICSVPRHICGTFVCSCGDNPGSANLGGFKESASFSNKPCRQCYVSQHELYKSFEESDFVLRSKTRHLVEVHEVETNCQTNVQNPSVEYGVNSRSILMDIDGCDVTKCLPQDVMHDTIEGTLKLDICCTLYHVLVEKKSMSIDMLNQRIRMFSKSVGANKPPRIDMKHVNKFKLKLTAAQALNLARILPFVLRKKNFVTGKMESVCSKENLLLLMLRLNLTDLLLSEEISSHDVLRIRNLMKVHHNLFQQLYPGREIPKMHYELHFATHILLFGPPRQFWCMRYEGKHAEFKRRFRLYRSLKDHAGTLAMAHQRSKCGQMLLCSTGNHGPFLESANTCGASVPKPVHSLPESARSALNNLPAHEVVLKFKVITVKGVTYRKGSPIMTSLEGPIFGKVMHLLQVRNELVLIYQRLDTVQFAKNLNAFKIKHTNQFEVLKANDLCYDHRLLLVHQVGHSYIVVPSRSYLSSQDFHPDAMV